MTIRSVGNHCKVVCLPLMDRVKNLKLQHYIISRLKELRERKGLTQEIVYDEVGIHIGRIEAGKRIPSVSTLAQLCVYFGLSLSEFFEEYR